MPPLRLLLSAAVAISSAVAGTAKAESPIPLTWGGAMVYTLAESRGAEESGRTWRHTATTSLELGSYIYAPWLAKVNSKLNLSLTKGGQQSSGTSQAITGSLGLSVLPLSRYPTELSYTHYDARVPYGNELRSSTGDTFLLRSRVFLSRTLSIATNVTLERDEQTDGSSATGQELDMRVQKIFETQEVEGRVRVQNVDRDRIDGIAEGRFGTVASLRHRAEPLEDVTMDTLATAHRTDLVAGDVDERLMGLQGVTSVMWRPRDMEALTVNGALRTFRNLGSLKRDDSTTESSGQATYGTASANYRFSRNLGASLGVGGGYTSTRSENGDEVSESAGYSANISGNIGYNSDRRQVAGFDWGWNAGGGLGLEMSRGQGGHRESARIGHNANRTLSFLLEGLKLNLSQNLTGRSEAQGTRELGLSHQASLSRSRREGRHWDYYSVSATDYRTFGDIERSQQLLNLQVTRGYYTGPTSSLRGSLSYQLSRATSADGLTVTADSVSANATYEHSRLFGMRNLSFSSELSVYPPYLFIPAEHSALDDRWGRQQWTNRLRFEIGKLKTSLSARLKHSEAGFEEHVIFQIQRRF